MQTRKLQNPFKMKLMTLKNKQNLQRFKKLKLKMKI